MALLQKQEWQGRGAGGLFGQPMRFQSAGSSENQDGPICTVVLGPRTADANLARLYCQRGGALVGEKVTFCGRERVAPKGGGTTWWPFLETFFGGPT